MEGSWQAVAAWLILATLGGQGVENHASQGSLSY